MYVMPDSFDPRQILFETVGVQVYYTELYVLLAVIIYDDFGNFGASLMNTRCLTSQIV